MCEDIKGKQNKSKIPISRYKNAAAKPHWTVIFWASMLKYESKIFWPTILKSFGQNTLFESSEFVARPYLLVWRDSAKAPEKDETMLKPKKDINEYGLALLK